MTDTDHVQAGRDYAAAVGRLLREVRTAQGMSLHEVERRSGGRWNVAMVGSYERGDRTISVARLAELAGFYGVPPADLLPAAAGAGTGFQRGWEACAARVRAVTGQVPQQPETTTEEARAS